MKIRIIFRGNTILYVAHKNEKPVKLVCMKNADGDCFDFINNPHIGYSRDYNKTIIQ
jgi:hypothetical protein